MQYLFKWMHVVQIYNGWICFEHNQSGMKNVSIRAALKIITMEKEKLFLMNIISTHNPTYVCIVLYLEPSGAILSNFCPGG